jgi:hypothetical protein
MKYEPTDVGQSLESLPAEKRIERYRQFADAAFLKAQKAQSPEQKADYLSMAASWHSMARELERILAGPLNYDEDRQSEGSAGNPS